MISDTVQSLRLRCVLLFSLTWNMFKISPGSQKHLKGRPSRAQWKKQENKKAPLSSVFEVHVHVFQCTVFVDEAEERQRGCTRTTIRNRLHRKMELFLFEYNTKGLFSPWLRDLRAMHNFTRFHNLTKTRKSVKALTVFKLFYCGEAP